MRTTKNGLFIPIHEDLIRHPKLARLSKEWCTKENETIGILVQFLLYVLRYFPDGVIPENESLDLAKNSNFKNKNEKFLSGLIKSGFLDNLENGVFKIHNWDQYGGKLHKKRALTKKRVEKHRSCNAQTSVTSALRNAQETLLEVEVEEEVQKEKKHTKKEKNFECVNSEKKIEIIPTFKNFIFPDEAKYAFEKCCNPFIEFQRTVKLLERELEESPGILKEVLLRFAGLKAKAGIWVMNKFRHEVAQEWIDREIKQEHHNRIVPKKRHVDRLRDQIEL